MAVEPHSENEPGPSAVEDVRVATTDEIPELMQNTGTSTPAGSERTPSWKMSIEDFSARRFEMSAAKEKGLKITRKLRNMYNHQNNMIENFENLEYNRQDQSEADTEFGRKMANILAKLTLLIDSSLLVCKLAVAILSGSLSFVASLVDSCTDIMSGTIIWVTNRAMRLKRGHVYQYPVGKNRLEPVSLIVQSTVMALASLIVVEESLKVIIDLATKESKLKEQNTWFLMNFTAEENCTLINPSDIRGPTIGAIALGVACTTVGVKLALYLACRRFQVYSSSLRALAMDHRNDVVSNIVALSLAYLGYKVWPYFDALGAIIISVYFAVEWFMNGRDQIRLLVGYSADPDFYSKVLWVVRNHDERITKIDTVRAYHFGAKFLVEVDIVLPEEMPLKEAHNIGESLQNRLETMGDVERCFVHLDYEWTHSPNQEHQLPNKVLAKT